MVTQIPPVNITIIIYGAVGTHADSVDVVAGSYQLAKRCKAISKRNGR